MRPLARSNRAEGLKGTSINKLQRSVRFVEDKQRVGAGGKGGEEESEWKALHETEYAISVQ
jgi:hypothetical protein